MKRARPEDAIQIAIVELLTFYERQGRLAFFAVPNGEKRDKVTAARLKRLGTRAGIPDLVVLFPGGHTVFLEVKAPDGSLSKEQKGWFTWLNKARFAVHEVRSVSEAQAAIEIMVSAVRAA